MLVLVLLILVALAFDFMNGFHDAANSVATIVSTRVLTPRQAVLWAAMFNFVAAFGFGEIEHCRPQHRLPRCEHPRQAVLWAAMFNFVAAFGFGVNVATTELNIAA